MASLNWGRALTGVGENIGQMIELKQREKEMAWEEARAIRLENLRARNVERADKRQAGYRLTAIEATGKVSMGVAEQTHKWAIERADTLFDRGLTQDTLERERFVADEQRKNTDAYGKAKAKLITLRERESMSADDAIAGLPDEVLASGDADSNALISSLFSPSGSGGYKLTSAGFKSALKALDDSYAYVDASLTMDKKTFKTLSSGVRIAGTMENIKVAISDLTRGEPLTARDVADSLRPPSVKVEEPVKTEEPRKVEKIINQTTLTPDLSSGGLDLSSVGGSFLDPIEYGEGDDAAPPRRVVPGKKLWSPTSPGEYKDEFLRRNR